MDVFLFVCALFVLFWLFVVVRQPQTSSTPLPPPPPSNFIAGRPKAALLFGFFGGFRCGMWSPTLFNIFLELIMSDALEEHDGKVSIGGRNITICVLPMT